MKRATRTIWCDLMPSSPVFTTAQVAEIAGMAPSNASRDLAKLAADGLLTHVRRGLWAIPTHPEFSAHAVVPHLFNDARGGYVSATSALRLHGMIRSDPVAVQVMTATQRPLLRTPVATYEFHRIQEALFGGFEPWPGKGSFDVAGPEKALFDALYLSTRKNRRFARLPRIDLGAEFAVDRLKGWIARVEHAPLRRAISRRWDDVRQEAVR
jgi:predicted transcriptional regulator of viral defense system